MIALWNLIDDETGKTVAMFSTLEDAIQWAKEINHPGFIIEYDEVEDFSYENCDPNFCE